MREMPAFGILVAGALVTAIAVVGCTDNPVSQAAQGAWKQGEDAAGRLLESVGAERSIDQSTLCTISDVAVVFGANLPCQAGQKTAFLPRQFGNEQLPIMFAAKFCDLRYQIVWNPGGVVCIYRPLSATTEKKQEESGQQGRE